jgi:hypothetical protein
MSERVQKALLAIGGATCREYAHELSRGDAVESLELRGGLDTKISPVQAAELAKALAGDDETGFLVKTLSLSNNHIGDEGAMALATALVSSKTAKLKSLGLVMCGIGDEGAGALCEWLEAGVSSTSLTMMCIEGNPIGSAIKKRLNDLANKRGFALFIDRDLPIL